MNIASEPRVSIVVVTWNSEKDIEQCLQVLVEQDYHNFDIRVVDCDSHDNTVNLIKRSFPQVKLILPHKNLYFAGGHNLGINDALAEKPKYIAIINPDAIAEPNWLRATVDVAEKNSKIGIVGPKIKFFWDEKPTNKINSAGLVYDGFLQAYDRGFKEEDTGQYERQVDLPAVSGGSMLLRSVMLKQIGVFWEILKMYNEDVELCIRARKAGWRIVYTPKTIVWHKYMQSTSQNKNMKIDSWKKKNWLLIALRHYKWKSKLAMVKHYFLG